MIKANSYSEAQTIAKANPNKIVQWDAGEGWIAEGYYCETRKRVITKTYNPETGGHC